MGIRKPHSLSCKFIDMRRRDFPTLAVVALDVSITEIVRINHNNIRNATLSSFDLSSNGDHTIGQSHGSESQANKRHRENQWVLFHGIGTIE